MQTVFKYIMLLLAATSLTAAAAAPATAAGCRIVSLAPALTEIVCLFDNGRQLVGRCSACDYPEQVKALPAAGRFGIPDIERIIQLRPTWIIGNDFMNPNVARKLRDLNFELHLSQINTPQDYLKWVQLIGRKLNKPEVAQKAAADFQAGVEQLKKMPPLELKVLWVVNAKPLIVAGPGSLPDQTLQLMKMQNAAAGAGVEYFKCSAEWVLSQNIELIIWGVPGTPNRSGRFWSKVPAVRKDAVVYHDIYDPVTRPGPRYIQAVKRLRQQIADKWKVLQP